MDKHASEDGGESTRARLQQHLALVLFGEELLALEAHFEGVFTRRRRPVLLRPQLRQLSLQRVQLLGFALEFGGNGDGGTGVATLLERALSLSHALLQVLHRGVRHGVRGEFVGDLVGSTSLRVPPLVPRPGSSIHTSHTCFRST